MTQDSAISESLSQHVDIYQISFLMKSAIQGVKTTYSNDHIMSKVFFSRPQRVNKKPRPM